MTNKLRKLYHGNLPEEGEKLLLYLKEKLEVEHLDFEAENTDFSDAVILLSREETENANGNFEQCIRKVFEAHCPIFLFTPNQKSINDLYRVLERQNLQGMLDDSEMMSLFGVKLGIDGIHYSVYEYKDSLNSWANSIVEFADSSYILERQEKHHLLEGAKNAWNENNELVDLVKLAEKHVVTYQFRVGVPLAHVSAENQSNLKPYEGKDQQDKTKKDCSISFFVVSCHIFKGEDSGGNYPLSQCGEDWYYIKQTGILNGSNNYVKRWVHGTTTVYKGEGNSVKCYVNGGHVCLNYINHYDMENILIDTEGEVIKNEDGNINLIMAMPEAINGVTQYTDTKSHSITGAIGFEGGEQSGGNTALGKASLTAGATFTSSVSFAVQDCSCKGDSLGEMTPGAKWIYTFKRAAWHGRDLYDPAQLACSVFSPTNTWIWRVPTYLRGKYKEFKSIFKVYIVNTTTRNTGSISPSHHEYYSDKHCKKEVKVPLKYPPLLCSDKKSLAFGKESGMQGITVAAQGFVKISTTSDWIKTSLQKTNDVVKTLQIHADDFMKKQNTDGIREGQVIIEMFLNDKYDEKELLEKIVIDVTQTSGIVIS